MANYMPDNISEEVPWGTYFAQEEETGQPRTTSDRIDLIAPFLNPTATERHGLERKLSIPRRGGKGMKGSNSRAVSPRHALRPAAAVAKESRLLKMKKSLSALRKGSNSKESQAEVGTKKDRKTAFQAMRQLWMNPEKKNGEATNENGENASTSQLSFGSTGTNWPIQEHKDAPAEQALNPELSQAGRIQEVSGHRVEQSFVRNSPVLESTFPYCTERSANALVFNSAGRISPTRDGSYAFQRRVATESELRHARSHQGIIETVAHSEGTTMISVSWKIMLTSNLDQQGSIDAVAESQDSPRMIACANSRLVRDPSLASTAFQGIWENDSRVGITLPPFTPREQRPVEHQASQEGTRKQIQKRLDRLDAKVDEINKKLDQAIKLLTEQTTGSKRAEHVHNVESRGAAGHHRPMSRARSPTSIYSTRESAQFGQTYEASKDQAQVSQNTVNRRLPPANRRLTSTFEAQIRRQNEASAAALASSENRQAAEARALAAARATAPPGVPQGSALTVPQFHAGSPGSVTYELPTFLASPTEPQDSSTAFMQM